MTVGELGPSQLRDLVERRLDAATHRGPRTRMVVVAHAVAEQLDPASWWISTVEPGTTLVVTALSAVARRPEGSDDEYYAPATYDLADYPVTRQALAGTSVLVAADDPASDPAEVALLRQAGLSSLAMAGGTDPSGRGWLLEVLGDDRTASLGPFTSAVQACVTRALLD